MTRVAGAGLVAFFISAALAATGAGDDDGFVSLFNGRSLDGWTPVSTDHFLVRDGSIVGEGGTGWLRSAKVYKNFEFHAEYRVVKPGSDSGVFFRASAESTPKAPNWPVKGYQLQVIDGDGNFMVFGHGVTVTFDRKTDVLKGVMKGPGEWQTLTLKAVGGHAEASLNGKLISVSDTIGLTEGHLGLQGENGHFEWRALRIKESPAPGK